MKANKTESVFIAKAFAEVEFVLGGSEKESFWIFRQVFSCCLQFYEKNLVKMCLDDFFGRDFSGVTRDIDHVECSGKCLREFEHFQNPFSSLAIHVEESGFVGNKVLNPVLFGPVIRECNCERVVGN